MKRHLDTASALTLFVTLVLFVIALFIKGFSHDLLLEAAIFLVSVKLVLASYKHDYRTQIILERLDQIHSKFEQVQSLKPRD